MNPHMKTSYANIKHKWLVGIQVRTFLCGNAVTNSKAAMHEIRDPDSKKYHSQQLTPLHLSVLCGNAVANFNSNALWPINPDDY